jgi:hypothetical protein
MAGQIMETWSVFGGELKKGQEIMGMLRRPSPKRFMHKPKPWLGRQKCPGFGLLWKVPKVDSKCSRFFAFSYVSDICTGTQGL